MIINKLKKLFCYHKWIQIDNPYLWEGGTTKRADVKCVKCGKSYKPFERLINKELIF